MRYVDSVEERGSMVRKQNRRRRLAWMSLAAALTLAAAAGIAYATIPDGGGVIHGCYKTPNGQLRVIDSDSESCSAGETALTWSQTGPPGPAGRDGKDGAPGAPGSAAGFARVTAAGTVDPAQSQNVTSANVTHPAPGLYCFGGLSFTPRAAVATGVNGINAALEPTNSDTLATVAVSIPNVTFPFGCAETDQARVRTIAVGSGTTLVDRPFFVWFED
jgi:hypothetical protein